MIEKEKLERSDLAINFLNSRLWRSFLGPWVEKERKRLMQDYISFPLDDKFHTKMEDIKARYTACSIIEQQLRNWAREKEIVEKNKELEKARQKMIGPKGSK